MTPRSVVSQVLLTIVLLLFLLPFAWMISNSLKPPDEIFTLRILGSEIRWGNYAEAWGYLPFGRFMLNGLFVALWATEDQTNGMNSFMEHGPGKATFEGK
jgi:multiple sugar transport system permease protein